MVSILKKSKSAVKLMAMPKVCKAVEFSITMLLKTGGAGPECQPTCPKVNRVAQTVRFFMILAQSMTPNGANTATLTATAADFWKLATTSLWLTKKQPMVLKNYRLPT